MNLTRLIVVAITFAAFAAVLSKSVSAQNGYPPDPVVISFDIPPGDPLGACAFPINISAAGKGKFIVQKSGNLILTSPNLNATVTNLNNTSKQVSFNITGVFHVSDSNGKVVNTVTGRNLLTDPTAGVVLAIGNFSFVFDSNGNLIQPLTRQGGTLIDICALLN
jgi:hypothetical protein